MKPGFIPVFTSQAGLCLTMANWQELGIETQAFYLQDLLIKPGIALLDSIADLRSYCGWPGTLVLNASLPAAKDSNAYSFRSPFDGSLISICQDELYSLLIKLQPDVVILPKGFTSYLAEKSLSLPEKLRVFAPANELLETEKMGVYLNYDKTKDFADFFSQVKQHSQASIYLSGPFDCQQAKELIEQGASWLESDKPASDAVAGQVYEAKGNLNLVTNEMTSQHEPISAACNCPTCQQKLTRAYLHHLYSQTPLLCHRFLIQHNIYFYQNKYKPT